MNIIKYTGTQFANPRGLGGQLSTFLMNRLNIPQYKSIESVLTQVNPERSLDIGFGNGQLLCQFARRFPGQFYGIETSADMLELAARRGEALIAQDRLALGPGNALQIPFPTAFFDFVYTVNTIYFWEDPLKGCLEIYRVLKPGAVFANAFYTKAWLDRLPVTRQGFMKYTAGDLARVAEIAGFENLQMVELLKNNIYCLVAARPAA
ncbi:class I SAM-dependent methyltransferase [Eubacterium sp. 1001713B170207_170306_E7]|uniref:class I SAM-dependent methyltransferase n=1 Tax=Eubacterium sp. 1001713B170207_170306_E7 TaxID=2787097 RepID=UPI00189BCD77|nr:class I SAM-dependent methyltransferase [Eubacterium sp. 1001713B170207_170306_E7]